VSSVSIDGTRMGVLGFTPEVLANPCVGPLVTSMPVLVTGTWGPHAPPRLLEARAGDPSSTPGLTVNDTVTLRFDEETNTPLLDGEIFSLPLDVRCGWTDAHTAVLTVKSGVARSVVRQYQVGVLRAAISGVYGLRSRDLSSNVSSEVGPNASVPLSGSWGIAIVSVESTTPLWAMPTVGGAHVRIVLSASISDDAAGIPARVSYSNGARSYEAADCALASSGDSLTCVLGAGVGAGHLLRVDVLGVTAFGGTTLSYASPVLTACSPTIVSTRVTGGLVIEGHEFGGEAENAVSDFELYHPTLPVPPFRGGVCRVNVSDSLLRCDSIPDLRGSALLLRLKIGGQSTAQVALATSRPVVNSVSLWGSTCDGGGTVCTRGGSVWLNISGSGFGPARNVGIVVRATAADGPLGAIFTFTECAVVRAHTVIVCTRAPAGCGMLLTVTVWVLGVASPDFATSISFTGPSLAPRVGGDDLVVPTAGGVVVLRGHNFCLAYPGVARVVVATMGNDTAPGALLNVVPQALQPAQDDPSQDELVFLMPPGTGRGHQLWISVVSDSVVPPSAAVQPFAYLPPYVLTAGMSGIEVAASGLPRYRVQLAGGNFGGAVSPSRTTVTVGGGECTVEAIIGEGTLQCWTAVAAGAVRVVVAEQATPPMPRVLFNANTPAPTPIVGTLSGDGSLPLAGGGPLIISGADLVPTAPSTAYVLPWGLGPTAGESACVDARAHGAAANWCSALVIAPGGSGLQCTAPSASVARASLAVVVVALTTCSFSSPFDVTYAPPLVTAVTPRLLPTAGWSRLNISGENFEVGTQVLLGGAPCAVLTLTVGEITCESPPGGGVQVAVATISPTHGMVLHALAGVGYRPPRIGRVAPSIIAPQGGDVVVITGSDLSVAPIVRVGAVEATVLGIAPDYSTVTIRAPPGVGIVSVRITAAGQSVTLDSALSYSPPRVTGINVSFVDAVHGGAVRVSGSGFGPPHTPVAVSAGGVECDRASVLSDDTLECVMPPAMLVAPAGATLVVSVGASTSSTGNGSMTCDIACPTGYYGAAGERCTACPIGGVCESASTDPAPAAGYFRLARASFQACIPSYACVALPATVVAERRRAGASVDEANGNCAPGYVGVLCSGCDAGYYRKDAPCIPCPKYASVLIVLFLVALCAIGGAIIFFHRRMINVRGGFCCVDFVGRIS
jgi:hypothetical protein